MITMILPVSPAKRVDGDGASDRHHDEEDCSDIDNYDYASPACQTLPIGALETYIRTEGPDGHDDSDDDLATHPQPPAPPAVMMKIIEYDDDSTMVMLMMITIIVVSPASPAAPYFTAMPDDDYYYCSVPCIPSRTLFHSDA